LKKGKKGYVSKLTQMSGLGLKLHQGDGVIRDARFRKSITLGNIMRMSGNGMSCTGCGMAYNEKFIFENVAL
jgi:hypothetical protein